MLHGDANIKKKATHLDNESRGGRSYNGLDDLILYLVKVPLSQPVEQTTSNRSVYYYYIKRLYPQRKQKNEMER